MIIVTYAVSGSRGRGARIADCDNTALLSV